MQHYSFLSQPKTTQPEKLQIPLAGPERVWTRDPRHGLMMYERKDTQRSPGAPLWTGPATRDVNPLGQTRALLALDVDNVRVAAAAAPHAVLLGRVPLFPVQVLLPSLPLVRRRHLEVRVARELSCRRVGGAVLDRGMPVPEVAEVVDVARREEDAGCEGVDWCVTPLLEIVSICSYCRGFEKR